MDVHTERVGMLTDILYANALYLHKFTMYNSNCQKMPLKT